MAYVVAQADTYDVKSRQLGQNHPEYIRAIKRERSVFNSLNDQKARVLELKKSLRVDTYGYNSLAPGNPPNGDYSFQIQGATSWALFASFDYRPTDRWNLKAGLRYTTDEKDFSAERPTGPSRRSGRSSRRPMPIW